MAAVPVDAACVKGCRGLSGIVSLAVWKPKGVFRGDGPGVATGVLVSPACTGTCSIVNCQFAKLKSKMRSQV